MEIWCQFTIFHLGSLRDLHINHNVKGAVQKVTVPFSPHREMSKRKDESKNRYTDYRVLDAYCPDFFNHSKLDIHVVNCELCRKAPLRKRRPACVGQGNNFAKMNSCPLAIINWMPMAKII